MVGRVRKGEDADRPPACKVGAGYLVFAFTSNDGDRQVLLMVNEDGSSLTKRASSLFFKVIDKAYCTAGKRS
jgi:hypothetical protein